MSNNDQLYFLYSNYSKACGDVFSFVRGLAEHIPILPICIDDPSTREKITKTTIKTVPSIIAHTQTDIQIYEGQDLVQLLQKLHQVVANSMPPPPPPQQPSMVPVQSIAPPPQPQQLGTTNLDYTSSVNQRLAPVEITSPPQGQPMLTTQISQAGTMNTQQQAQQYANMAHQQSAPPLTSVPPPAMDGSQMLDVSSAGTFTKGEGYSHQDITGSSAGAANKGNAKQLSESMLREREQMDKTGDPRMRM